MIKLEKKKTSSTLLPVIVCVTAISYFLFYYLFIHTITTTDECSFLDEFWLGGARGFDHPLGMFTLVAALLCIFTIVDLIAKIVSKRKFSLFDSISYVIVLSCIAYWGYGLFQLYENTQYERGYRPGDYRWYETTAYQVMWERNVPKIYKCQSGI